MKLRLFLTIFTICIMLIVATYAITRTIHSNYETLNKQKTAKIETIAANAVQPYIVKDYDTSELNVEIRSVVVYPLYDYTPSEIGDCAEEIAMLQHYLYHPNIETDITYIKNELESCNGILIEMIDGLTNTDSIRKQSGWLVEYSFKLSARKNTLPPIVLTRTFQTNTDFKDVMEVFQPEKADMLKRRDIIIQSAFEKSPCGSYNGDIVTLKEEEEMTKKYIEYQKPQMIEKAVKIFKNDSRWKYTFEVYPDLIEVFKRTMEE